MRLLLDTHTFLWWVNDATELSTKARKAITSVENQCFLSLASCWEMSIKVSLNKLRLTQPIERFVPEHLAANEFRLLGIEFSHIARTGALPFHHRDPFDRLLAAQALSEDLAIASADPIFRHYGIKRVW